MATRGKIFVLRLYETIEKFLKSQLSGTPAANCRRPFAARRQSTGPQPRSGMRQAMSLIALRSKNKTWLTIADSAEGRYGLDTRKAGSGRFPVRKRSG